VMGTVLEYAMDAAFSSEQREILAEYRESDEVRQLFARGVVAREAARPVYTPPEDNEPKADD